jgi:electron transport complex protein RnfD
MISSPKLVTGLGPFLHTPRGTRWMMWQVVVALLPIGVVGVAFFGLQALVVVSISVVTAWSADLFGCKLNGQQMDLYDASPLVTGLLLAYMLPPTVAWFVPAVGALFAIFIGKQLFGGLGYNLFNPVLVSRALLQWSYPDWLNLTRYPLPIDVVSAATPLHSTTGAYQARLTQLVLGTHGGSIGETSALLIALCGLYLIIQRVIDWRVPLLCLLSVFTFALLLPAPEKFAGHAPYLVHNPLYHVLSGGIMLSAFFLVTDPVTTPLTVVGRSIFVVGVGVITVLIRYYGIYPEGVAYAILIMNALTPIINRVSYPKPLGHPDFE